MHLPKYISTQSLWNKYCPDILYQIYILEYKRMVGKTSPWKVCFNNEIYLATKPKNSNSNLITYLKIYVCQLFFNKIGK